MILVINSASLSAQSKSDERKQRKAERKAQAELQEKVLFTLLDSAVANRNWVLEANRLQGKYGSTVNVSSSINFVAVEGEKAFIQLGSNSGMGNNGVGGITIDGTVSTYKLTKDPKSGYTIKINVMSAIGIYDVLIRTNNTGLQSTAEVRSNRGGRVSYLGELVPKQNSRVYKGQSVF